MPINLILPPREQGTEFQHLAEPENGWSITESRHFRIAHNSSRQVAEEVAKIAEETKSSVQNKWFPSQISNWPRRLSIRLFPDSKSYCQATGSSTLRPGYATIRTEDAQMVFGQIDMHIDKGDYLTSVLPHEVTHAVIGANFSKTPRWADEGMAILSESRKHLARYIKTVTKAKRDAKLFKIPTLLQLKEYPTDAERRYLFYCQSASLVDYLAKRNSAKTFIQFIRDSYRQGYITALAQNYGLDSLEELERRWLIFSVNKKS